jgi:hypothetical protein
LNNWYENKKAIIKQWNGELIKECGEISLSLNKITKSNKVFEFAEKIERQYMNADLSNFIFVNKENFFDNVTVKDYTFYDYTIQDYRTINKGIKIIKAFKYFVSDENILRMIQDEASMLLQQDKITGTLCFSVHPLDYLSISENNYNWRSCHALDGEFRAGNLSYMTDQTTIVCYLKGENQQKLPRFPEDVPWNNKKWRMLLFVSDTQETLFAGRQYPFSTDEGMDYVLKFVNSQNIIDNDGDLKVWSPWHKDVLNNLFIYENGDHTFLPSSAIIQERVYALHDIIKDKSSLHYNDLLYSHHYQPYYSFNKRSEPGTAGHFNIGNNVKCLCCNQKNITRRETMLCLDCFNKYIGGE